jgi:hypothetical protein
MKGKLIKVDDKWYVEYTGVSYSGGNPKVLGSYSKKMEKKTLPLLMDSTTFPKDRSNFVIGSRVKFTQVLVNPMGREVDPNDLSQNQSGCVWYGKIVNDKKDLGYTTKAGIEVSDEMVRTTMIPKEYFGKEEQKQHLIDMMRGDEELGLYDDTDTSEWGIYDESREIKVEDIFNDNKREKVKEVIHQHKVLQGLSLVNPAHLQMTSNGHGEFPDGYKLTEKGIQYIIEQLNKE